MSLKEKSKIKKLEAREILNSRGEPTIEAEIEVGGGIFRASVPSGASKGRYEAVELRDGGKKFFGKGVLKAVRNINKVIAPKLIGKSVLEQEKIDKLLTKIGGGESKAILGANATLAVSIVSCRAAAMVKKISLYYYIAKAFNFNFSEFKLPRPSFNILNGGAHAGNDLDIQEFMVAPNMGKFERNLRAAAEIYHSLKEILKKKFDDSAINLGDEGGFAPPLNKSGDALTLVMAAIKKTGYEKGTNINLDCAASQFFRNGKYNFEGKQISGKKLLEFYFDFAKHYPILFFEDPFSEDDWGEWNKMNQLNTKKNIKRKPKLFIVGDDLTATNRERIKKAREKSACNAVIIKPNQIGTLSEAVESYKLAKSFGWKVIVSHRSGETCDDFIADFAVGIGADFIKSGAPARGERVAKYNRLLKIEEELKQSD